jgi:hypothetical protein
MMGVVMHVGGTLHGYRSVMLGVQETSTFQIVFGAFQLHPVLLDDEGVHFKMHLPSLEVH